MAFRRRITLGALIPLWGPDPFRVSVRVEAVSLHQATLTNGPLSSLSGMLAGVPEVNQTEANQLSVDDIEDILTSRLAGNPRRCPNCKIDDVLVEAEMKKAAAAMPTFPGEEEQGLVELPDVKAELPEIPVPSMATPSPTPAAMATIPTMPPMAPMGPIPLEVPTEAPMDEMHTPAWIKKIEDLIGQLVEAVEALGVPAPKTATCPNTIINSIMCTFDNLFNVVGAVKTVADVVSMNTRVLAGGAKATEALRHLHTLIGYPYGKSAMKALGTMLLLTILARKEPTPDYQRGLALSLMTKLSGVPTAIEIDDVVTGSFPHVNIAVPSVTEQRDLIERYSKSTGRGDIVYVDPEGLPHGPEIMSLLPPM